ncbi:MAG: leucine-rich repeat domain-containing protein [Duncaniella sp.]|nr:leucine-rich repeat domain-containing protein [Duncaniella sp.]
MKRLFSVIFVFFLLISTVRGADFTVDGICYSILKNNCLGVAEGSVIPSSGILAVPRAVDFGGSSYTVTSIDSDAFRGRKDLKEIKLPPTITSIGSAAFNGCSSLSKINLPEGVRMIEGWTFRGCDRLKSLVLPNSVEELEVHVADRSGLKDLTLGTGLKYLNGQKAFAYGHKLDLLTVNAPECTVRELNCQTVVDNGEQIFFEAGSMSISTQIRTLVLRGATQVFEPWIDGKVCKFASSCTVYVPDALLSSFRADPSWMSFKAILPLSKYKK